MPTKYGEQKSAAHPIWLGITTIIPFYKFNFSLLLYALPSFDRTILIFASL